MSDISGIRGLQHLKTLDLELNLIEDIPSEMDCPNLEFLSLNQNKLTSLKHLNQFKQLKTLSFFRN